MKKVATKAGDTNENTKLIDMVVSLQKENIKLMHMGVSLQTDVSDMHNDLSSLQGALNEYNYYVCLKMRVQDRLSRAQAGPPDRHLAK